MARQKKMAKAKSTTVEVTATVEPYNAGNKDVKWVSDNKAVATVTSSDNPATVTAIAEGSAIITCTTDDGGFTDSVAVTVTSAVP